MTRKSKGKRFADDESDLEELDREGNPNAREHRERVVFPQMPRWLYRVILILLISVAGLLVWFNLDNLTPQNIGGWIQSKVVGMGMGDDYPASLNNGRNIAPANFFAADKNVVVVSDTSITMLNSTAKELARRQHSFSNPVAKAWGQRVLVYNLGGTGFQVESISKAGERRIADADILAGAIAGNGRVALATESQGYYSRLSVYGETGKPFYTYEFSEYYVTHIALNRSGTRAAVAGVAAKNGAMVSVVYLFDFSSSKPLSQLTFQDNLILSLNYGQNGAVVAVGDRLTSVISENGDKTDYSYGSQSFVGSAVDNGRTALLLSPYANAASASLVLLDVKGKQVASVPLGQSAADVSMYGDTAAVLLSDESIHAYTASSGAQKGICSGGKDARAVTLRDESSIYVLGFNEIRLENFGEQQEQAAGSASALNSSGK